MDEAKVELPPLPKLDGWRAGETVRMDECQRRMREYARQAVLAERERAANLIEQLAGKTWTEMDERLNAPIPGFGTISVKADPRQKVAKAMRALAAAIRQG